MGVQSILEIPFICLPLSLCACVCVSSRIILPRLEQCRKFPIKLGEMFISEEEDFLNYSKYFKNMPHQTRLMEDGGIEFFAVSRHTHTHKLTIMLIIIFILQGVRRKLEDTFDLSSYLIKPFQRITKYKLFLAVSLELRLCVWVCVGVMCVWLYVHDYVTCGVTPSDCSLLQDMIKHSTTTDHKGKLKEYFDQLKVGPSTCQSRNMYIYLLNH